MAGILLGNQNLWFVLAEANGLSANDTLNAGQSITIPNNVQTAHFDSETHKVYNESEIIGNTMPNVRQKKKKKKCGSFLAIVLTVVVVVAAVVLTAGAGVAIAGAVTASIGTGAAAVAATVVLTAIAGAAIYAGLNIVQQGVMIAAGLQEGFDWNQVRDQARQGAFAGAIAGLGGFAGLESTAESTRQIINISKTALNVAYKAHQQVKQNGEITNWTGLLMAAAPAVGEFGFDKTAEVIDKWGDYATPWLGLAEKALNGDNISNEDVIQAAASTLSTAIDDSDSAIGANFANDNVMQNIAKAATAGVIYLGDRDAARDYLQTTIGQEVGEYLSGKVGSWVTPDSTLGSLGVQGTALATLQAGVSGFANNYLTTRMRSDTGPSDALAAAQGGLRSNMQSGAVEELAKRNKLPSEIQREQQQAQLLAVARELANQQKEISPELLAKAEQEIGDGNIKTPEIKLVDGLEKNDGVLGAYDSKNKVIEIDRSLYQAMINGDDVATAQFRAVYTEELAHSVASVFEQALDIKDFKYDEGAQVARSLLQKAVDNGDYSFSVEVDGSYQTFTTSEEALQSTIDRDFGLNRIYQDYQDGAREFRGMDGGFYKNRDRSLSPEQSALGVLEFLANGVYNTGVDAAAGIGGLGALIVSLGDVEKSAETIAWVQDNLGLDLQTEGGQAFAQALADSAIGDLAASIDSGTSSAGDAVLDATGSPFLATLVSESPEILASVLGVTRVVKGSVSRTQNGRLEQPDRVEEPVVLNKVDDVARAVTRDQSWFDDVALNATRNPDSNRLVLGHFAREGTSYQKVAAHYEASYFKVDDWNSVTKGLSNDEIWRINETFLDQQVMQGKQILFSHNPLEARPSSFFEREVNYLQDLGYNFKQKNQWTWEAIYEPK